MREVNNIGRRDNRPTTPPRCPCGELTQEHVDRQLRKQGYYEIVPGAYIKKKNKD
ncbi:MAG: hypothetical protein ACOCUF_03460 [Patescibacteria group bacterium]